MYGESTRSHGFRYTKTIKRDFLTSEFDAVNDLLALYISDTAKGRNRVCASVLKLSKGNITLVKQYVDEANKDFRDIIAQSEYPNYTEHAFDDLTDELEITLLI